MLRIFTRRSSRHRYSRVAIFLAIVILVLDYLSLSRNTSVHDIARLDSVSRQGRQERIFIASVHWNNAVILRSHWNDAVVDLVQRVGKENLYLSVYESGSWDDSKGALTELDDRLRVLDVQRSVVLDPTTHEDELAKSPAGEGWVETSPGRRELRRIPYLARLRNLSLEPLRRLAHQGIVFDKILFLNDVVFTTDDVMKLLRTRHGDYAAACSLDFSRPPWYYDTFALRDSRGRKTITQTFPYFAPGPSREAMMSDEVVPVQSCWNGMVFFDAQPFYARQSSSPSDSGLRFRGIPDTLATSHLEASECCLIHYDNPLTRTKGVFVNPAVRVGYNPRAYSAVAGRAGPSARIWPSLPIRFLGIWWNRLVRLPRAYKARLETRTVRQRVANWEREKNDAGETNAGEVGEACLINEMQVLADNGWAHV